MHNKRFTSILAITLLPILLCGCLWTPDFSYIVSEMQKQSPEVRFKKELQLNLGPSAFGLARTILSFASDHDNDVRVAKSYLAEVQRMKLAIYDVYNLKSAKKFKLPPHLLEMIQRNKWETAVKVHEKNEFVIAVYKQHRQSISEMFVLSLDRNELVMVQIEGRLDKLFEKVMEEHVEIGDVFMTHN